jgi:DNA-binding transcriptional MerR regulator
MDDFVDDVLSGRDKLLTSGEVSEILNVNANTLYLWRQSDEVNLPFQRFVAPGQTRGMIRYKYSDVLAFIEAAAARGMDEKRSSISESGGVTRTVSFEISDDEELQEFEERLRKKQQRAARKKREKSRAEKNSLKRVSLTDAVVRENPELLESQVGVDDESEKTRRLVEELLEEFNSFGKLNGKYEDAND